MRPLRSSGLTACLVGGLLAAAACGDDPPENEIQQARSAIDAARAGGADEYAHADLAAAEDALKGARDAIGQHDYRLALNDAIGSREQAQIAAKETADRRAAIRTDAEHALRDASAALVEAKNWVKAADTARVSARLLSDAHASIDVGEKAVQEARAAVAQGNYREVPSSLKGPTQRLTSTIRDLDAARSATPRKRR